MSFKKRIDGIKRAEEAERDRKQRIINQKQAEQQAKSEKIDAIVNLIQSRILSEIYPMLMKIGRELYRQPIVGYRIETHRDIRVLISFYDRGDVKSESYTDDTGSSSDHYYRGIKLIVYQDRIEFYQSVLPFTVIGWPNKLTELILNSFEQLDVGHTIRSHYETGKLYYERDDHSDDSHVSGKSLFGKLFGWLNS